MVEIGLNKINKSYGFNKVLNDFSMSIKTNEKVALIGPNGCGKTTTIKIIASIENCDSGIVSIRKESKIGYLEQIPSLYDENVTAEEVYLKGIEWLLELKSELDTLSNNLSSSEKSIKKYTALREEFEIKGGYLLNEKINKIKHGFKLSDELLNTPYNKLSGGEKTIINLASLVLSNPDILLLDEPTNHLDIDTLEWFEEYLKSYSGTVLIISHDRYFLDRVVNKIIFINNGKEDIYYGNYSYYVNEYEKRLLLEFQSYKNQQKEIKAINEAIERYREWGEKSDNPMFFRRMHALEKRLERIELIDKPVKKKELPITFNTLVRTGDNVLSIKDFTLEIGNKVLLDNVKCNIYFTDRICLMGRNGSGKTTLIKNIMNNTHDNIKIGTNVRIGYIPQEIRFDNEDLTIFEYVRSFFVGSESKLRSKLIQFYFGNESLKKKINTLSGGEKVRIKLLELILKDINLLILDEPTNHIDIDTRELLESALLEFKGTILFISHDRFFINKIATRIIRIENKKLVSYEGNYDSIKDKVVEEVVEERKYEIKINGSNRLNEFIKDARLEEITIGCSSKKVYKIRKKSKTFFLKIADHLSEEAIKLDYLSDKVLCPEKVFYEKYNNKSYLLTKSLDGEMLCSEYYKRNPLVGIKVIVEAFNNLYNINYIDCMFDETIDTMIKEIEKDFVDESITDERYSKRFPTRRSMLNYLKGNKPKSVIGFIHGDMSLPNIFGKDDKFTGVLDVDMCGVGDIYYDIVICEISIERNYGKEYVDVFYKELGIEKDEFKSDYYRILQFI